MKIVNVFKENWMAYLGLLPLLIFFVVLMWFPILRMFSMSFRRWILMSPSQPWIGLEHYTTFLGSEIFWVTFIASIVYFFTVFIQMALGVVAAFTLNQGFIKFTGLIFFILIAPFSIPPIVSGAMWKYMLDPNFGVGMYLLKQIGIIKEPIYWTFKPWAGRIVIMTIISWTRWPMFFMMVYSRLQAISKSQTEAALTLGASTLSTMRTVLLPQVKTTLVVVTLIRISQNFLKVSPILALTRGGPSYKTSIWPVLLYKFGFENHELGRASMVGVLLLLFMGLLMYPGIRAFNKRFRGEAS